ncbi:hypothetical protein OG905_00540 [Streptomyces sp. NBC_00322]|uniref:hypothetical protein n=1 Tax=Streptomyces sp. NBC_00322 TaxID=2975712 RepID=UPI002E28BD46|nr:hypothetical protein [Streptomyces sp. NBC_00322]
MIQQARHIRCDSGQMGRPMASAARSSTATTPAEKDSQVKVTAWILAEIEQAQRLADALGSTAPVCVKIDQNGLGHGAVGMLKAWAENGRHQAQIVGVMVNHPATTTRAPSCGPSRSATRCGSPPAHSTSWRAAASYAGGAKGVPSDVE